MPKKYLVEFVAEWIRDEELRKKVLYQELTELAKYGLNGQQIMDLVKLERDQIQKRMVEELEQDLNIDLDSILQDFIDTGGGGGDGGGAAYDEGATHVRGIEPEKIVNGVESIVVLRGHGWDDSLEVFFEPPGGGALVAGTVLSVEYDIDVWQRAYTNVTLAAVGEWRAIGRVAGNATSDSVENVRIEVV